MRPGIEIRGAARREPDIRALERNDAAQFVPDPRLGCPLRPRVPRIERIRRDLHEQQRCAKHRATPATRAKACARIHRSDRPESSPAMFTMKARPAVPSATLDACLRRLTIQAPSARVAANSGNAIAMALKCTPARESARSQSVARKSPASPPVPMIQGVLSGFSLAAGGSPRQCRHARDAECPDQQQSELESDDVHAATE